MKPLSLICLNLLCLGFLFSFSNAEAQSSASESEIIIPARRAKAPDFSLADIDGKHLTLTALRGRVVLLDFWAIECGGCKLELPWYTRFAQQYGTKGLSLIGLDMYGDKPDAVRTFAAAHGMHYPLAIGTDAIGDLYHVKEMPVTVLIDRQGRIAVSHVSVVDPKAFEANIKTLLSE